MSNPSGSETRKIKDLILQRLKLRGAQTATQLADQLQVSPMSIRQHLQNLKAKGWVSYDEERQPIGRPVKQWHLTQDSFKLFPNHHEDLAISLLQSAELMFGESGLDELLRHRVSKQIQRYQTSLMNCETWRDRTHQMAQLRSQEGYMAEVIPQPDDSLLLVENHCSICAAAQRWPRLCTAERDVFAALLGDEICIERVEHILGGDRRCAYRITPVAS
ncbi:MAG: HTH domain-containing protein [Elainellaceae cyanobacterium]